MISASDLKYFIEVAKTLHVSRAAERLGISQPTLSHCIHRIENSVGLELFIRTKKGVKLTSPGQRLFEQSQSLLYQWDSVIKSIHNEHQTVGGTIRLGCHTAVAQYTLPKFLPQFLKNYSSVSLQLVHDLSRHLVEEVISERIDIAIAVNPISHPDIIIKDVCADIVALWSTKNTLNKNLIIYDPSLHQSQEILKKLSKQGQHFTQKIESPSLEVICQLLKNGTGKAILPKRVVEAYNISGVSQERGAPIMTDKICLVYKPLFRKSKTGQFFIDFVRSNFF